MLCIKPYGFLVDFTLTVSVSLGKLADLAGLLDLVGLALLTFSGSDGELADLVGLADFESLSISAVKFSSSSSGIGRIGFVFCFNHYVVCMT